MNKPISIRVNDKLLKEIDEQAEKHGKTRTQYILDKIDSDNRNFNYTMQRLVKLIALLGNIISNNYCKKEDASFRYNLLEYLNEISELMYKIYTRR